MVFNWFFEFIVIIFQFIKVFKDFESFWNNFNLTNEIFSVVRYLKYWCFVCKNKTNEAILYWDFHSSYFWLHDYIYRLSYVFRKQLDFRKRYYSWSIYYLHKFPILGCLYFNHGWLRNFHHERTIGIYFKHNLDFNWFNFFLFYYIKH